LILFRARIPIEMFALFFLNKACYVNVGCSKECNSHIYSCLSSVEG